MQIVIKIPKELYTEYVNVQLGRGNGKDIVSKLLRAIKDGTPLPEHHGRIVDESKITKCYMPINQLDVRGIRTDAPTIIEGSDNND